MGVPNHELRGWEVGWDGERLDRNDNNCDKNKNQCIFNNTLSLLISKTVHSHSPAFLLRGP